MRNSAHIAAPFERKWATQMSHQISGVAAWIETLDTQQFALLQRHAKDAELPPSVLRLLRDSPLSPMLVSQDGGDPSATMAPVIRQALELRTDVSGVGAKR